MIVKMLEAVSIMLDIGSEPAAESVARVQCAKVMLDKIIEGMNDEVEETPRSFTVVPKVELLEPAPKKREPSTNEIEVVAEAGIIKAIKNAKENTELLVDGVKMPWTEAIGKSFTEITML